MIFFLVEGEREQKNTPYRLTKNKHGKKIEHISCDFFFVEGEKESEKTPLTD